MSKRTDDALLETLLASDGVADAVEDHLDRHPLPVDEVAARRAAERVAGRIAARSAGRAHSLFAVAAAVLLFARPAPVVSEVPVAPEPPASAAPVEVDAAPLVVDGVGGPQHLRLPRAGRSVELTRDARALSCDTEEGAVVLVQDGGAVADDGARVGPAQWVVLPPGAPSVVFDDGVAPGPGLERPLRAVRWASLPPRTLEALDVLLEEEAER